jgi:hypothetical protein
MDDFSILLIFHGDGKAVFDPGVKAAVKAINIRIPL